VKALRTPFKVAFAAALAFALDFLGFDLGPASTYINTNSRIEKRNSQVADVVCIAMG
jgi:hypothetical protein